MRATNWWRLGIGLVVLIAPSATTSTPSVNEPPQRQARVEVPPTTSVAKLHRGWMLEVLDLDTAGAARIYEEIELDRRPWNLARWIAAARLAELRRLGTSGATSPDPADAPQPLRSLFEEADRTLDVEAILLNLSGEPEQVLLDIAAKPENLPQLRPLVAAAESWFLDQVGPSRLDRWRQRRAEQNDRQPFTDRVFAALILRDELQGRRTQADERRSIYFMLWQPPKSATDAKAELARFRGNMEALLAEKEWTGAYRQLHGELQAKVEAMATEDPAAAMDLVRRLPQYAERLLAPLPGEGR